MRFQPRLIVLLTSLLLLYGRAMRPPLSAGDAPREGRDCVANLRRIGVGIAMYMADNDDRMPLSASWEDGTAKYVKGIRCYDCPSLSPTRYGYAFDARLSGLKVKTQEAMATVPVVFESSLLRRNAAGSIDLLPKAGRHEGLNHLLYGDLHVASERVLKPTATP